MHPVILTASLLVPQLTAAVDIPPPNNLSADDQAPNWIADRINEHHRAQETLHESVSDSEPSHADVPVIEVETSAVVESQTITEARLNVRREDPFFNTSSAAPSTLSSTSSSVDWLHDFKTQISTVSQPTEATPSATTTDPWNGFNPFVPQSSGSSALPIANSGPTTGVASTQAQNTRDAQGSSTDGLSSFSAPVASSSTQASTPAFTFSTPSPLIPFSTSSTTSPSSPLTSSSTSNPWVWPWNIFSSSSSSSVPTISVPTESGIFTASSSPTNGGPSSLNSIPKESSVGSATSSPLSATATLLHSTGSMDSVVTSVPSSATSTHNTDFSVSTATASALLQSMGSSGVSQQSSNIFGPPNGASSNPVSSHIVMTETAGLSTAGSGSMATQASPLSSTEPAASSTIATISIDTRVPGLSSTAGSVTVTPSFAPISSERGTAISSATATHSTEAPVISSFAAVSPFHPVSSTQGPASFQALTVPHESSLIAPFSSSFEAGLLTHTHASNMPLPTGLPAETSTGTSESGKGFTSSLVTKDPSTISSASVHLSSLAPVSSSLGWSAGVVSIVSETGVASSSASSPPLSTEASVTDQDISQSTTSVEKVTSSSHLPITASSEAAHGSFSSITGSVTGLPPTGEISTSEALHSASSSVTHGTITPTSASEAPQAYSSQSDDTLLLSSSLSGGFSSLASASASSIGSAQNSIIAHSSGIISSALPEAPKIVATASSTSKPRNTALISTTQDAATLVSSVTETSIPTGLSATQTSLSTSISPTETSLHASTPITDHSTSSESTSSPSLITVYPPTTSISRNPDLLATEHTSVSSMTEHISTRSASSETPGSTVITTNPSQSPYSTTAPSDNSGTGNSESVAQTKPSPSVATSIITGSSVAPSAIAPASTALPPTSPTAAVTTSYSANPTQFLPTALVTAEPGSSTSMTNAPSDSETTRPSATPNLPYQIAPQSQPKPDKSQRQVQLGFLYPLNYPFVAQHPGAAAQIFNYVPQGLAQGLNIDVGSIVMAELDPYQNNSEGSGFLQTIAKFYIPKNEIAKLQNLVVNHSSPLYRDQSDPTVGSLMHLIDDKIPVSGNYDDSDNNGDSQGNDGKKGNDHGNEGNGSQNNDNGRGLTGNWGSLDQAVQPNMSLSRSRAKVAGIAIGTIVGAGILGSGLFLLSAMLRSRSRNRREKEFSVKRLDMESYHDESSSLASRWSRVFPTEAETRASSAPAAVSAASGGGAAAAAEPTQQQPTISYPIVTENSLGWQ